MLENAVYSVISPEGCASILWKDSAKADEAAEALKLTADDLHNFGMIDAIIREDGEEQEAICAALKQEIVKRLRTLKMQNTDALLTKRYEKFRKIGR